MSTITSTTTAPGEHARASVGHRTYASRISLDSHPTLSILATGKAPSPEPPVCIAAVPLDVWFMVLAELHPRHAWKARNVNRAWRSYVEEHLARVWFRHTFIEVKWAPFFRIYDSSLPSLRDPYPLLPEEDEGKYLTFVRPEIDPSQGRRANVVKRLFLHQEVTVSFALRGEVCQPMKVPLRILRTNDSPSEDEGGEQKGKRVWLSANGRKVGVEWRGLMERACRQKEWAVLAG